MEPRERLEQLQMVDAVQSQIVNCEKQLEVILIEPGVRLYFSNSTR